MKHYSGNVRDKTVANRNYREVLYTGPRMQLAVMSVPVGEETGEEMLMGGDSFIRCESGEGKAIIDGAPYDMKPGDAFVVPAGTRYDIVNVSSGNPLQLYMLHAPPEFAPDTVHPRKSDE